MKNNTYRADFLYENIMIQSMTGYGKFKNQNEYTHIHVEIRSLNSRFFEFYAKPPKVLSIYDNQIKNKIKEKCNRGSFQLKASGIAKSLSVIWAWVDVLI